MSVAGRLARGARPPAVGDAHALAVVLLLIALAVGTLLSRLGPDGPAFPTPRRIEVSPSDGLRPSPSAPAAIVGRSKPGLPAALDLNASDVQALQNLPGVGPILADRIMAYRRDHGPFRTPEDLLQVPGIGPKRWERIRDLVRVGEGA